ncbi:MAG: SDR family NAD(P)-dependent oxidoreductase [Gammaproteobacteria bacterium]|nr:SDR family NAD(P)-dependent oxidoreductase [Gammaproteobacteria bacterium]
MTSRREKTIWLTGASTGLGRSIAEKLAREGHRLIVSARNAEALAELAEQFDNVTALPCDITSDTAMAAAGAELERITPHLDQVILNAGNCEYLDFPNPDWGSVKRVMTVNYFGTVNCLEQALPLLRRAANRDGHVVVVASQVTNAPFPRAEAYGASKAALQYFCDSLRIDLAAEGIDVTVVNPGFVDTPLTRKNDFDMPFLMAADDAADRIVRRIAARPSSYSFPFRLSALLSLSRVLPGLWRKLMAPGAERQQAQSSREAGQ